MRHMKIATLEVYLNDDDTVPSRLSVVGPKQFALDICPMMDERILDSFKQNGFITGSTVELMQTIIAHELGHFVAHITGCPTHKKSNQEYVTTMVDGKKTEIGVAVPAEMKAWTLAGEMLGEKLHKPLRDIATATYMLGSMERAA